MALPVRLLRYPLLSTLPRHIALCPLSFNFYMSFSAPLVTSFQFFFSSPIAACLGTSHVPAPCASRLMACDVLIRGPCTTPPFRNAFPFLWRRRGLSLCLPCVLTHGEGRIGTRIASQNGMECGQQEGLNGHAPALFVPQSYAVPIWAPVATRGDSCHALCHFEEAIRSTLPMIIGGKLVV